MTGHLQRVAEFQDLDADLLGLLQTGGAMSSAEMADPANRPDFVFLSETGIEHWAQTARRRGLVEQDPAEPSLWRLTEEGNTRLSRLQAERRFIPKAVSARLLETVTDGLLLALKTFVAGVPALFVAWAVGLFNDPSAVGFGILGAVYLLGAALAVIRWRSVKRARFAPVVAQRQAIARVTSDISQLTEEARALARQYEEAIQYYEGLPDADLSDPGERDDRLERP
jgi:hypothetical protein